MDYWILENIEKLVPVVIAVLYFLGSNKAKKAASESESDPEAEARARRIQEEIRRRILERQGGGAPEKTPPASVFEQPLHPPEPESAREVAEVELFPREVARPVYEPDLVFEPAVPVEDPFAARRREIEEQLEKARSLRAQIKPVAKAAVRSDRSGFRETASGFREELREDLRDSGSIRRAIVLKEILDAPLALRR